ncbi:MAG: hypothetical protein WC700_10295 [Gemmatimonadaceae bacterium]|jgi:hypothetical protein
MDDMCLTVSPEVIAEVKSGLQKQLAKSITDGLGWKVQEIAGKYFDKEIAPAVAEQLAAEKEELVAAAVAAASQALHAAMTAIADEMAKKLAANPRAINEALTTLLCGY